MLFLSRFRANREFEIGILKLDKKARRGTILSGLYIIYVNYQKVKKLLFRAVCCCDCLSYGRHRVAGDCSRAQVVIKNRYCAVL